MPISPRLSLNPKGLTFLEVLLTVAIIGVVVAVIFKIINPEKLRVKARDSTRVRDLKTIQNSVELYRLDKSKYPPSAAGWVKISGSDAVSLILVPGYIENLPLDPINSVSAPVSGCDFLNGSDPSYRYNYISDAGGNFYILTAQMEDTSSVGKNLCSDMYSWVSSSGCVGANPNCFGLENEAQ